MKRILYSICIFALTFAIPGCQKSLDPAEDPAYENGTISAIIEKEETKTNLDQSTMHVNWSAGDQIAVISDYDYNLRTYTLSDGAGTTSASFSADGQTIGGTEGTVYAAYYPASAVKINGDVKQLRYPNTQLSNGKSWLYEQTYYPGRPDPAAMFMRARGTDLSAMAFKNMTSVIKISVTDSRGEGAATIASIKLSSETSRLGESKYFDYRDYSVDPTQFVNNVASYNGQKEVILKNIHVKLSSTPTDFYIVVNGGIAAVNALTVTLEDEHGNTQSKVKASSFSTVAGYQYSLPAFECTIAQPAPTDGMYYRADGAEDWTKWVSGIPEFTTSLDLKTENAVITESFISDLANAIKAKGTAVSVDMSACSLSPLNQTFPNSFRQNGKIGSISLPGNTLDISNEAFYSSALASVTLPDGLKTIGNYSFQGSKLNRLYVPASVTKIGWFNLWGCPSSEGWVVDSGNASFSSEDGLLYNKSQTRLIEIPNGKVKGSSYTVKAGVEEIYSYCFSNKNTLEELTLPSSVKEIIGPSAFGDCYKLSVITIENTESVVTLASTSFSSKAGKDAAIRQIRVPAALETAYHENSAWHALETRESNPYTIVAK